MIGIALAGGSGTRLKPFTNIFNKHFFPVYDKPIIYYCLYQFELLKIKNICIVCNSRDKNKFYDIIKHYFTFNKIEFVFQDNPLGVLHGIHLVTKKYKNDELFINLGDHFLFNFLGNREILRSIKDKKNVIYSIQTKNVKPFGNLCFSKKSGSLIKIIEKPTKEYSNFILCGMIKLSPDIFSKIKLNKLSKRGEYEWVDFINENLNFFDLIKLNKKYHWIDLGTFDRISFAEKIIKKNEFY